MSWFLFALICFLGWGFADLFYKIGADESDPHSHLKTAIWVGIVMGAFAIALIPFAESDFTISSLIQNGIKYSPASLSYIISMIIGYAGLRYLELSIISPVQNASGALSAIVMMVYFLVNGQIESISDSFSTLDFIGIALIVIGVIALAFVEKRIAAKANLAGSTNSEIFSSSEKSALEAPTGTRPVPPKFKPVTRNEQENKKYQYGALALLFPILYCVFDTIGTAADGIILDEQTGLGLGEIDVIILYGLTFLIAGIVCWIYLYLKTKKVYNPFQKSEIVKAIAATFEEFGQIFYVYAMAKEPVLAAPMVASYCILSVFLSRVFIKEKLTASQYACVITTIIGIVILGISEGLAEM